MRRINIKEVASSQHTKAIRAYNKELFNGDRLTVDSFSPNDYAFVELLDTDTTEAQTYEVRGKSLKELIIVIDNENIPYLVNAISTSYNGDTKVTINIQELTLAGFNYFTKVNNSELDYSEFYNKVLVSKGYDFTIQDIKELGEYKSDYNCTTLSFTVEGIRHWITVNSIDQLSSIKTKEVAQAVTAKKTETVTPSSILA